MGASAHEERLLSISSISHGTPFNLVSSDGISIPCDPVRLASHSKVFQDLLEMPSEEQRCTLGEPAKTINLFLDVLAGKEKAYDEKELVALSEMGDKYDCACVKAVVRSALWRSCSGVGGVSCGLGAYALSTRLGDPELSQAIATQTLVRPIQWKSVKCDSEWRLRLEKYHLAHVDKARKCLFLAEPKKCDHSHSTHDNRTRDRWKTALVRTMKDLAPSTVPHRDLKSHLEEGDVYRQCASTTEKINAALAKIRSEFRADSIEL